MEHRLAKYLLDQHDRLKPAPSIEGHDCPDENLWAQLADDLLSPSEEESFFVHISQCPSCRRRASEIVTAQPVSRRTPLIFRLPWAGCALAAGLALAVGVSLLFSPRGPSVHAMLAEAERHLTSGEYRQARETLDRALAANNLAVANRERARELYEKAYTASVMAKLERKQYHEAQEELSEAMKRGFRSADLLALRGRTLLSTALAMGPSPEDKLTALGFVGILDRRTKALPATMPEVEAESGISFLREAADRQPQSVERWRELGKGLLSVNRYAESVDAFQQWCRLTPTDASAHNATGLALYAAERYKEAVAAFGEASRLQSKVPAYEFNAAMACEETGQLDDAVGHWKRYLAIEPRGAQADEARKWLNILERGIKK